MEALTQQLQAFMTVQNQQNHNSYDLGDDSSGRDDFQEVDEDFEEEGNNYFESEPIFETSDMEEDDDRLNLGPKFDLSDDEDEIEFDEHEQTKNCEFCPDFVITHSNEVSIQESIQEYAQGDVQLFVVKHVCCDPYLTDEDPSHKRVLRFFDIEFVDGGVILC